MPMGSGIVVDGPSVAVPAQRPPGPEDDTSLRCPLAARSEAFLAPATPEPVTPQPVRWLLLFATAALLSFALAKTPHQRGIAPLIESDYAYQLIAADRLYAGQGLTSLPPVAPHQPWQWQFDWGYLTQWPAGYPLAVCAVRAVIGGTSIDAAHWISAIACAFALVGWFAVVVRAARVGVSRYVLAAVVSGLAVPAASLINPSTDAIIMAILPWLILALSAVQDVSGLPRGIPAGLSDRKHRLGLFRFALIGLAAGALVWIRYAAVFVSAGMGLYLLILWMASRRVTPRHVLAYALGAVVPIAAMVIFNRMMSSSASVSSQLNLGTGASASFSLSLITTAWAQWTALGLYDYRPGVVAAFSWWPLAFGLTVLMNRRVRRAMGRWVHTPAVGVGACLVVTLLTMLVSATALFGGKFHYVGLDRYYLPAKPLYVFLLLTPLFLVPRRGTRVILCAALSVAMLFIVQVSWSRTLQRWHAADRPTTPYGAWSRAFEPDAAALFGWLKAHHDPSLVIVSNFHEFVTLETGIPALPIPPDRATLDHWLERIAEARGLDHPRVLFALDPDNQWRDYWLPKPSAVRDRFSLSPYETVRRATVHDCLFTYDPPPTSAARIDPLESLRLGA